MQRSLLHKNVYYLSLKQLKRLFYHMQIVLLIHINKKVEGAWPPHRRKPCSWTLGIQRLNKPHSSIELFRDVIYKLILS